MKLPNLPHTAYRESLAYLTFSPDGKLLATRHPDDSTVIWDTSNCKERVRLKASGLALAFTPDSRTLISTTRDGLILHWDLATAKCTAPEHEENRKDFLFVENATASEHGNAAVLSDGRTVLVKDTASGRTVRRFEDVNNPALSRDGKVVALGRAGLFEVRTGKRIGHWQDTNHRVETLAFSPVAQTLAMSRENRKSRDTSIALWDVDALCRTNLDVAKPPLPPAPLEATLSSRKTCYALALGGKSACEIAKQIRVGSMPPAPQVDLVLTVRNESAEKMTIWPDTGYDFYVCGDGAINHPETPYQSGYIPGDRPKDIVLAPGDSYSLPIKSLDLGHDRRSYWVLPGEYSVFVHCSVMVIPEARGARADVDPWFAHLRTSPLRVKVVAE
jgi:WD40 repeat protein